MRPFLRSVMPEFRRLRLVTSEFQRHRAMARKRPRRIYYVDNNRSGLQRAGCRDQAGSREATELSIPNIITLGRIILVPVIVWAIVVEPDGDRVRDLPHCRRQRRGRRVPRQALQHGERTRRPARSAGRQGAAGLDLRRARDLGRGAALDRDPGGLARHHDRHRRDRVLAVRQAGRDEAV